MAALAGRIAASAGLVVALLSTSLPAARGGASPQAPPGDAAAVLAAARQALGGEEKLNAVRTFVATGRTRQIRGDNLVPIEFEISCELPDKFVRRDEIPAQESGPTSSGFSGETLIQVPLPPAPGARPPSPAAGAPSPAPAPPTGTPPPPGAAAAMPPPSQPPGATAAAAPTPGGPVAPPPAPPDPRKARVVSLKQDFVRLTLGLFAASFPAYPLTFTLAGRAEAPQGTAEIIDVKGPDRFSVRLFVHSDTHLPIMLSWTVPATNAVIAAQGAPPPQNVPPGAIVVQAPPLPGPAATKEEQEKYAQDVQDLRKKALAGAKPVEHRLYYADYREVGNGLKFPFRLRRAIGAETTEETNFDAFKINARIDPRKFESR